jgi:HK97 family phage major capsid protein
MSEPVTTDQVPTNPISVYIENLDTARKRAWNEGKQIIEAAAKEGREMTGEERAKYEKIDKDVTDYGEQIADFTAKLQSGAENDVLREAIAPMVQAELVAQRAGDLAPDPFNEWRTKGGVFNIDITAAALQKQMIRDGMSPRDIRNDMTVGTTTAGGHTVQTTLAHRLYDFLEVYQGIRQTNVTVLTVSKGEPLDFPTATAHGTAAILGEGTAAAEADPALGKVTLTFYKYAQLLQITQELLTDTSVDITGFIAKDMGRAIGRVTDTAYLTGSGTNAPTGALVKMGTATTIQTVSTGVPSYANLVDTVYSINDLYQQNSCSWLMRQAMAGAIRKLTDTTGNPIWQPSLQVGQPDTLLGYPVHHDPNLGAVGTAASTAIAFGDWSPFYIGEVGGVNLALSTDFAFSSDLVTYRATYRTASNLLDLTGAVKKVLEPTT